MTRSDRVSKSWIAFFLGLGLRLSDLLDPIHELFHYAWANIEGIEVTSMSWSRITYARESILVLYGGYMSEFTVYGGLVFLLGLSISGQIGHKVKASFFLGILLVAWLSSFFSSDFNSLALRMFEDQGRVDRMLIMWGVWSTFWMIIILKTYFYSWGKKEAT